MNSVNATVNDILRELRHFWPCGLTERGYSTLNLMAYSHHGEPRFSRTVRNCHHSEWYASSCGQDRRRHPVPYPARRVCAESLKCARSFVAKGLESFSLVALAETE